ncbi:arginine N-succinyltransferase [Marinobacterium jannaschii]|uniref:arginine N-succinyltransferase n=1 Tax=Marinobacterium jannaschii TaxID=64970 RepID=UPI000488ED36|nr:arginine N-succinyltransferase [Marinobacterium jannaschii]
MMVVRPLKKDDWQALRELARQTGTGFTSLQDDDDQVTARFEAAIEAFAKSVAKEMANYLFVMEDTDSGEVVGICGIEAAVGLSEPWYNFRVGTLVHASRDLSIYNQISTLTNSNDHTGHSEVCTLFLRPDYRRDRNGHLLSKSRFLFMAEFPHMFHENVIAEMRGYSDENGVSPFWEGLGRHFFSIDFAEADMQSAKSKSFIAELMPKHTIYANLLPPAAQDAISQTHKNTVPARKLLEAEGFRYTGYIDIFDGGPLLESRVQDIRAVRDSRYAKAIVGELEKEGPMYLVGSTSFDNYRCCMTPIELEGANVARIPPAVADALQVSEGDTLRIVPLFPVPQY